MNNMTQPEADAHAGGVYRVTAGELRSFVERVERLNADKQDIAELTKEVFAEAKARGYQPAVMRKVIARRKREADDLAEEEAVLEMYEQALGGTDMAGSVNKVILIGNLGRDPEVRSFQNGNKVCNLRIATSETWKDKASGERKERTEWHTVAIFNDGLVRIAEQYLKKGSKVYIEGQLQTRKWQDQSGADKYSTEVVLQGYGGTLTMLDGQGNGNSQQSSGGYESQGGGGSQGNANSGRDLSEEIPFSMEWRI